MEKEFPGQISLENVLDQILLLESHNTHLHIKSSEKSYRKEICWLLFTLLTQHFLDLFDSGMLFFLNITPPPFFFNIL